MQSSYSVCFWALCLEEQTEDALFIYLFCYLMLTDSLSLLFCLRLFDPAPLSGEGEAQQGTTGFSLSEERRRQAVLPVHQAFPHLYP